VTVLQSANEQAMHSARLLAIALAYFRKSPFSS